MINTKPLDGIRIASLALNLPGPLAAQKLLDLGASVIKIEPPSGDPFESLCQSWYHDLCRGQQIVRLNIKTEAGMGVLDGYLTESDLLLTAFRPSALRRLSLSWDDLHSRYPRLCQVALVGYPSPNSDKPGHDLLYRASLGLISPPQMPQSLMADLAGAERMVSEALSVLFVRERGKGSGYREVSLADSAAIFLDPIRYGLTAPGGILGGSSPRYTLYETQEGWIAVTALEEHFWQALTKELGLIPPDVRYEDLKKIFLTRTADEWEEFARVRDIPLVALRNPG